MIVSMVGTLPAGTNSLIRSSVIKAGSQVVVIESGNMLCFVLIEVGLGGQVEGLRVVDHCDISSRMHA